MKSFIINLQSSDGYYFGIMVLQKSMVLPGFFLLLFKFDVKFDLLWSKFQ